MNYTYYLQISPSSKFKFPGAKISGISSLCDNYFLKTTTTPKFNAIEKWPLGTLKAGRRPLFDHIELSYLTQKAGSRTGSF